MISTCVINIAYSRVTYRYTSDDREYTLEKYTEMQLDDKRMIEAWRDARIAMVSTYCLKETHACYNILFF